MTDILQRFNWVDIIVIAILTRSFFVGMQKGVVVETFKLLGVFFALLITFHYYSILARVLHFPEGFGHILTYVLLWAIIVLDFKLLRDGLLLLVKVEAQSLFDKWGGLVLGLVRGLLICGLTVLLLRVGNNTYFMERTQESITGPYFARFSAGVYENCFNGFVSKFFPKAEINKQILILAHSELEKKSSSQK